MAAVVPTHVPAGETLPLIGKCFKVTAVRDQSLKDNQDCFQWMQEMAHLEGGSGDFKRQLLRLSTGISLSYAVHN